MVLNLSPVSSISKALLWQVILQSLTPCFEIQLHIDWEGRCVLCKFFATQGEKSFTLHYLSETDEMCTRACSLVRFLMLGAAERLHSLNQNILIKYYPRYSVFWIWDIQCFAVFELPVIFMIMQEYYNNKSALLTYTSILLLFTFQSRISFNSSWNKSINKWAISDENFILLTY